jgi:hypothetical protein
MKAKTILDSFAYKKIASNFCFNLNPTGGDSQYISTGVEVGFDSHAAPPLLALRPSPHPLRLPQVDR